MLSPIEKACLLWISQGKSVADISLLAGRPLAEIELCLSDVCDSLGAHTIADAVEKATLSKDVANGKVSGGVKAPNPIDVEVGARIRSRRRLLGLSQGKLAEALGITFQQVQKYEKGTNRVGASRLQNVANVLRVHVEYFFDGNAGQAIGSELLAGHDLNSFLQTAEARELNVAFSKIRSPAVRKCVVVLVKAIAASFPTLTSEAE